MARHRSPMGGGGARRDPRQVWENAVAAHRASDFPKAEKLYRSLLKLVPDQVDTIENLALVLERLGRGAEALRLAQDGLRLAPERVRLEALRGRVHAAAGRPERAVEAFGRVLARDPSDVRARHDRASARLLLGQLDAAEEDLAHLESVTSPGEPFVLILRGNLRRERGDAAGAAAAFREAAAKAPQDLAVWMNLGQILAEAGDREGALAAFREARLIAPERPEPVLRIAEVRSGTEADEDFDALARLAKDPKRSGIEPHTVLFTYAKALSDRGEVDRSFDALARAHAAKRRKDPYDRRKTEALLCQISERYTEDFLSARVANGHADDAPVFVVGMPRSATSLVEQILASHPQVHGAGEVEDLRRVLEGASLLPDALSGEAAESCDWAALGQDYATRLRARAPAGALRIVDKSPLNSLWIGAIRCMLPNARIVVCDRDPRDTCWSIYRHDFAGSYAFAHDLGDLGAFHRAHDAVVAQFASVVPEDRLLRVRYEELVDGFEPQVERLLDFVGVPFDPACLAFHQNDRAVRTASAQQVREPLFRTSIGAWRRFERQLAPLLASLGST
jgi:tetratricopeptide (TPR) repeat protein